MPLLILATGSVAVLLLGALSPYSDLTFPASAVALAGAFWCIQTPPAPLAPALGLSASPESRIFTILFCIVSAGVLLISKGYNQRYGIIGEEYPATILFSTFGMAAVAASTNLMILFLGLEAMTFGFYILVAIDINRSSSSEAGLKYLLTGAVAAAFLVFGIALHYAGTGSLSTADALQLASGNTTALAGWGLILTGIAFKLSLVPAHLWTPDVYQGAPAPVAGLLSAASKGVTVLALLLLVRNSTNGAISPVLWTLSLLSMLVGNLAPLMQTNIRRILAYSSIGHMGYVALALLSGDSGGYRAAAWYAFAYAVTSLAAFGAVSALEKNGEEDLENYRGFGFRRPFTSSVLALSIFSLAGIPPTAGFTGKFLIFSSALRAGETSLAIIGMLTAAASVFYYLKIVATLYMKPSADSQTVEASSAGELAVIVLSAAGIILFGLFPSSLLNIFK
jgi:NADH-quinone oxidoreductase subunit N